MSTEYQFWSATRLAEALRAREIHAVDLITHCLQWIQQVNPPINAVVQFDTEAVLRQAEYLDQLAAAGKFAGPLHGVPVTIKDSLDVRGVISTGGTMGRRNHVPVQDATVVSRLRHAGALILGKTNTPELTFGGETDNLIYGLTSNPHDPKLSPGGSSGGSAAILAAGGPALELGTDIGGSIREPAHFCGVAGIKPTSGRTPRTGNILPFGGAMGPIQQIGPMARYVGDLRLALPIICGPDGVDPDVVDGAWPGQEHRSFADMRIALYTTDGVVDPDPEIQTRVRVAADVLSDLGCRVDEIRLPGIEEMVDCLIHLRHSVVGDWVRRLLKAYGTDHPAPALATYLESRMTAVNEGIDPGLLQRIDQLRSQAMTFMTDYDAIVCPASHATARPHGDTREEPYKKWSHIIIQNLLGWPCAVVPAGRHQVNGLPIGVQVVAAPWKEYRVLQLAEAIEGGCGGYLKPDIEQLLASS